RLARHHPARRHDRRPRVSHAAAARAQASAGRAAGALAATGRGAFAARRSSRMIGDITSGRPGAGKGGQMIDAQTTALVAAEFPAVTWSEFRGDSRAVVPRESLYAVLQRLRDARGFDFLVDITCVDYLNYRHAADRFGLVYLLANTATNERVTLRVFLNEPHL